MNSQDAGHFVEPGVFSFRIDIEVYPLDHLLHVRPLNGSVLKLNETRFAVQEQDTQTIFHAEFSLQSRSRAMMQQRCGHRMVGSEIDLLDVTWLDIVFVNQSQHFSHGWMRQGSGRMRLDRNTRGNQRPGFGQSTDNRIGIESTALGLKKPERRLENVVGGCPSERCQVNRQGSIFCSRARLERLGHGTKIISEASAFGRGNAEGILCLQQIQAPQLGTSRRAAERSAGPGRMKTFIVMSRRNGFGNLAFNLHADVIGEHKIFSRSLSELADCKRWRK